MKYTLSNYGNDICRVWHLSMMLPDTTADEIREWCVKSYGADRELGYGRAEGEWSFRFFVGGEKYFCFKNKGDADLCILTWG